MKNYVFPCVLMQNYVFPCVLMQNYVFPCVLMQNYVSPCVLMQNYVPPPPPVSFKSPRGSNQVKYKEFSRRDRFSVFLQKKVCSANSRYLRHFQNRKYLYSAHLHDNMTTFSMTTWPTD